MLVIHRASEPPKLANRAPAPAHRVWSVRSVLTLLVALLVVSNVPLAGGASLSPHVSETKPIKKEEVRPPDPRGLGRPGPVIHHSPSNAADVGHGVVGPIPPSPPSSLPFLLLHRRLPDGRSPPSSPFLHRRLPDGRYALPSLNQSESERSAFDCHFQIKTVLQRHPVELLERGADGRFQSISMSTPRDKIIFSELRKRYTTAMTDVLATAVIAFQSDLWNRHFEPLRRYAPPLLYQGGEIPQPAWNPYSTISALQSLVSWSSTQSASGKLKLSVLDLTVSLLNLQEPQELPIPSVAQRVKLTGTNLSEVSSIVVQGDSLHTLLDIELKPQNDQSKRYLGRANLDTMIDTINTAMDGFLNAPP